jgi:hypothetical protein
METLVQRRYPFRTDLFQLSARILKRLAAIAHKLTENWLPIPFY